MDSDQILDIALILTGPRPLFGIRISFLLSIIFCHAKYINIILRNMHLVYITLSLLLDMLYAWVAAGRRCVLSKLC